MEDYGTVSSVKFINDRTTGRFRGIAFVEMEDDAAAAKAIAELDGAEFFGRQMVVKAEIGDPEGGIEPGTQFEDIPDDWVCPLCGVGKEDFEPYNG